MASSAERRASSRFLIERLRIIALPMLAAAVSLFAGLVPELLDTGRVDPLDWLVPGFAAFCVMSLAAARGGRKPGLARLAVYLALALLPALLASALIATVLPWARTLVLATVLMATAALLGFTLGKRAPARWIVAGLGMVLLVGETIAIHRIDRMVIWGMGPQVGVLTALPLFSGSEGRSGLLDIGEQSPLFRAVYFSPKPVNVLDADSLKAFPYLLLAQPRLLRPEELAALDGWVRAGGHVTILADPLLRWSDGRPLGDPRRAPLTSLLDPLLSHWGLTLEPADVYRSVERRVLANGSLIQLAGASRFGLAKGAPCVLEERGLIARCRIGRGKAVLVADADWINDDLWTLQPDAARDRSSWISDAAPVLSALAKGESRLFAPTWPWLVSQEALISALRWALALIVLLGGLLAQTGSIPKPAHDPPMPEQGVEADSGGASPDSG